MHTHQKNKTVFLSMCILMHKRKCTHTHTHTYIYIKMNNYLRDVHHHYHISWWGRPPEKLMPFLRYRE